MSEAAGLLRVTVAAGSRRADLALPGGVPVVELLPELARAVGVDSGDAAAGCHLVAGDGRRLDVDVGLAPQGVDEGAVLAVVRGEHRVPQLYDDVVEAVTHVVQRDVVGWGSTVGRRAVLWAASLLAALGACALVAEGGRQAGAAAAALALVLAAGAVLVSRAFEWPVAGVALTASAACHAAVAGVLLAPTRDPGDLLASSGGAVLAVGLLGLIGLSGGRALALPPTLAGVVVTVAGLVLQVVTVEPAVVLAVTLTLVALAGGALPWLAVGVAGTHASVPVDLDAVAADSRLALDILVASSATVGVLLVLVAPFAVSLGAAGALLVVSASLAAMLRPRHYHARVAMLTGLVSGVAGLAATGAAVVVLQQAWRSFTAPAFVGGAAVLLAVLLLPLGDARRRLLGDLAEGAALLALPPLLVLATGLVEAVR